MIDNVIPENYKKKKQPTSETYNESGCGAVQISAEKFENSVFTLKTHQMFSVPNRPEKFENTTIIGHFGSSSKKKAKSHDQ